MNISCLNYHLIEGVIRNQTDYCSFNATGNDTPLDGSEQTQQTSAVTLFLAMTAAVQIALGCSAATLNYFLLYGLRNIENSRLKVKALIQTTAIANIVLPFASGLKPEVFLDPFWKMNNSVSVHITMVYRLIFSFAVYVQSSCNLGLACDRLYAVTRPLQYHTTGYDKALRVCMFISPALVALLIYGILVAMFLQLNPPMPPDFSPPGVVLMGVLGIQDRFKVVSCYLLLCNCSSFLMYMSLWVVLRYQRGKITNVSESWVRSKNGVLSLTYFLTNLSTLLLYCPAPIMSFFIPGRKSQTMGLFTTMYMVNSSLVPLVLMVRIPSVRKNLPFKSHVHNHKSRRRKTHFRRKKVSALSVTG